MRAAGNALPRLIASVAFVLSACGASAGSDAGAEADVDTESDSSSDAALDLGAVDLGAGDAALMGCTAATTCPAHFSCRLPFGTCGASGMCETRPTPAACASMPSAPVCGCDGVTYGSACAAYEVAASVRADGACP